MSKTVKALVEIRGTRPLLWDHFGPEAIPLERKERTGVAGNDPEEWKRRVLMTSGRQLYLPPDYVFACVRDGAKYTKKGRATLQTQIQATLRVLDEKVLVDRKVPKEPIPSDPHHPVYIDIRSVRNPATKGRNVRYRIATSPAWTASFKLEWDATIVSKSDMEKIIIDAGALVGIGSGRAIGMGRFELRSFKPSD